MSAPVVNLSFPHEWQAEILPARPLILPSRQFVYPQQVEEVERGALEVLVRPAAGPNGVRPFLATCALGFRDPIVPTGIWSTPDPSALCAVSGGYAYVIDTNVPARFAMIPYRPVLRLEPVLTHELLLFVGHHRILAWERHGQAWESEKLSDEGITIDRVEDGMVYGKGWAMMTDAETPFALDLQTGKL